MNTNEKRYPRILIDHPGTGFEWNGFGLISDICENLKLHGASLAERDQFIDEALSGSHEDLLETAGRWITWRS